MRPLREFCVVIPVKDRFNELHRCLSSLDQQTFTDFHVVIVDDHSSIDISPIVKMFKSLDLTLMRNDGKGANAARNMGARLAKANYIAYLDSDDVFLPEKLERAFEKLSEENAELFASKLAVWRNENRIQKRPTRGPFTDEDISEYYFVGDHRIQSSSIIIKTELAMDTLWNEKLSKVQDPDFFIRAYRKCNNIYFENQILAVLYDIPNPERISNKDHSENIKRWLESDENPLTDKARRAFIAVVMSFELAKTGKLKGLKNLLVNCKHISPSLLLKTCIRILLPEHSFKALTQWILRRNRESNNEKEQTLERCIKALEERSKSRLLNQ